MKKNLIGQRIGQYRIAAPLGNGTSATVYRAEQLSAFGRDVAIKIMRSELMGEADFAARLEIEARTIAALRHPNILRLIEFFVDQGADGEKFCLVMDYMSGGSLSDLMAQGPLPLERVEALCEQIAAALTYAHRQGIVHRDLKPHNVLLDENGSAMLSDFGIAKLLSENISMTRSGAIIGTPAYMSPEQWEGGKIDPRTDIYSFGVMVYEMLSGELPFKADTATSMMFQHLHLYPQSIEIARDDLPRGINAVLRQAIAKKPDERFASAEEFFNMLRTVLHGGTVSLRPLSPLLLTQYDVDDPPTVRLDASGIPSERATLPDPGLRQTQPAGSGARPASARTLGLAAVALLTVGAALVALLVLVRPAQAPVISAPTAAALTPLPANERLDPSGLRQVLVPAGCFTMGSDPTRDRDAAEDELPPREVCLSAFWVDVYEVTYAAYQAFVDAGGYTSAEYWTPEGFAWLTRSGFTGPEDRAQPQDEREARVNLSWYEADAYARWRGGRLATEAEWEYAARGANNRLYAWGDGYQLGYSIINESSRGGSAPIHPAIVGSRPADRSWAGVYDLVGNACEWVNDWYAPYPAEAQTDPTGAGEGTRRVIRGGSFTSSPVTARLVVRAAREPDRRARQCGLRVVMPED